jgi:uracil-DNA glycosylase
MRKQKTVEVEEPAEIPPNADNIPYGCINSPMHGWTHEQVINQRHPPTWHHFFESAKEEIAHACKLANRSSDRNGKAIYPRAENVIDAFWVCPLNMLKVVIIGQDPYSDQLSNGMPRAVGMSYSTVRKSREIPASLKTVYKELEKTVEDWNMPNHGDLNCWARQGVLLLNTALTVEVNNTGVHTGFWKPFTEKLMEYINEYCKDVVFLLWGRVAQNAAQSIYASKHHKLETYHPSPNNEGKIGREFAGCDHFNECNRILLSKGIRCIDWRIT